MPDRRPPRAFRFGLYELYPESGELRRAGIRVALQDQPFRILVRLLEQPGTLVTRDELRELVWPANTFVDFEQGLNAAVKRLRDALGDSAEQPRFVETLPRRGYRFIAPVERSERRQPATPGHGRASVARAALGVLILVTLGSALAPRHRQDAYRTPIRSIAILPLRSLTEGAGQEWFAAALTEALGSTFSQIGSLTPVSSTSTRPYDHAGKTPAQIADELGVDALLEGSVSRGGDRVSVRVALIDPLTGRKLWARSYEREIGDALAIQNEIALAAARELSVMLDSSEQERLSQKRPLNTDAYVAYLRGRYLSTRWQEGGCPEAEPHLLRAAQLEPWFAPAHATLAFCYVFPDRTNRAAGVVLPLARVAAAKAVALDDLNAEAHLAMGLVKGRLDYDWAAAEAELRRATELAPGSAGPHIVLAELLVATGRADEGVAEARYSLRLSPYWMDNNVALGHLLLRVGRYEEASQQLRRTLELDDSYSTARLWLAESYAYQGAREAAVAEYLSWLDRALLPSRAAQSRARLEQAYARSGWLGFWRSELELAEEEARRPETVWRTPYGRYCGPIFMARRYGRLGAWSRVLTELERAYESRHHLMMFLEREPYFDGLRQEPRFRDLVRRVGLDRTSLQTTDAAGLRAAQR